MHRRIAMLAMAISLPACGASITPAPKAAPVKASAPPVAVCDANEIAPPLARPRSPSKAVAGPVTGVRFRGQTGGAADLEAMVSWKAGAEFDLAKVELDIRRLWALGRFDDIAVEADTTNGDLVLVYVVEERKRTGKVVFDGVKSLPGSEVDAATAVHAGDPFDPGALYRTSERLRAAYIDVGYRFATVEPHALRGPTVDVCLRVDEGPKVTIDQWIWKGATAMPPERLFATTNGGGPGVNEAGGVYRADVWARDAIILTAFYYDRGYLTVSVGEPDLAISADKKHLTVTVPIDEGGVYRIGKLAFAREGDKPKDDKAHKHGPKPPPDPDLAGNNFEERRRLLALQDHRRFGPDPRASRGKGRQDRDQSRHPARQIEGDGRPLVQDYQDEVTSIVFRAAVRGSMIMRQPQTRSAR